MSANGAKLATGAVDGPFHLWDLSGAKPVHLGEGIHCPYGVTGLAFVQKDQFLAVSTGDLTQQVSTPRGVFLWNLATKKQQRLGVDYGLTLAGVRSLAASAEHRLLAWCTDVGALVVHDLTRPGSFQFSLKTPARSMAISPDGKLLAAATGWEIHIFDLQEKSKQMTLTGHKSVVSSVAFSPDGKVLMSASWDKTVKWWNVSIGRERQNFNWSIGAISTAVYAPDGLRAAAAGDDGKIVIWDVDE